MQLSFPPLPLFGRGLTVYPTPHTRNLVDSCCPGPETLQHRPQPAPCCIDKNTTKGQISKKEEKRGEKKRQKNVTGVAFVGGFALLAVGR